MLNAVHDKAVIEEEMNLNCLVPPCGSMVEGTRKIVLQEASGRITRIFDER